MKDGTNQLQFAIVGISELKQTGIGHCQSEDYTVYYSGHEKLRKNDVAFIVMKDIIDSTLV